MIDINSDKPFFCYSKILKQELDKLGIRYFSTGKHDKTGNRYWLYLPSDELNNYLNTRREKFKN